MTVLQLFYLSFVIDFTHEKILVQMLDSQDCPILILILDLTVAYQISKLLKLFPAYEVDPEVKLLIMKVLEQYMDIYIL